MKIALVKGLPYIQIALIHHNKKLVLNHVLLDTGSASCVFPIAKVAVIGLKPQPTDILHRIRGVGGAEFVFRKEVDQIKVGTRQIEKFPIEIGAMDYGFEFDGIAGTDLLVKTGALINMAKLEIDF